MKSAMSDGQLVRPDLLALMAPLSRTSSWAVWGSARPVGPFSSASDISFPAADPDVAGLLHGRAVVVALNPGGAAAEWSDSHAWKNFHAGPRHNDHLLAEAFRDTPVWGG